jgi:hypothetical protein
MRVGEEQAIDACIEPEKRSKKRKAEEDDESRQLVLFHDDLTTESRGRSGQSE